MRFLLPLLTFALGCSPDPADQQGERSLKDSRGKTVRVPQNPRRIISLVPSTTELLFAVGAGDQIVGVTTKCDYPPEASEKAKIGDIVVNLEKLLSLKPDLIVTAYSMTRQISNDLEKRGLPVFSIEPKNIEGIAAALRQAGELTGHDKQGREEADRFLSAVRSAKKTSSTPTVYFEASSDPIWTAGTASYTGDVIQRAGGKNIFPGGWGAVDWERVLHLNPDVILIAHDKKASLKTRAGWAKLRAVRKKQVFFVAKEHFVYPTPRLLRGLNLVSQILHESD